jgi:putative protease
MTTSSRQPPVELLAPAGSPAAGYAAFQYGADAVYLGLKRFSARADADNFEFDELADLVGHAHTLPRRRAVYATVNTLIFPNELRDLIDCLARLEELEVDGVIVQDLGVAELVRAHFPKLALHASTQMAIHNAPGALAAQDLGFRRVVLARELNLPDIRKVTAIKGLETEVFIHGALCYAYSGLCLLSSLLRGRSGNRGSCGYPCRNGYSCGDRFSPAPYAMSMKDLALDKLVCDLREAGVSSLKIEGRKKSAIYVAAAVHYYRGVLDGAASADLEERRHRLQTVFSRPQTHFFIDNAKQNVVEPGLVGHLGAPVGRVERYLPGRPAEAIHLTPSIDLMIYDGLQMPIPGRDGKPFGFSVEKISPLRNGRPDRPAFESPAGQPIEIPLPPDHPPIAVGTLIYCASSQKAKQFFPFEAPKPNSTRRHQPASFQVSLDAAGVTASGQALGLARQIRLEQPLTPAKNLEGTENAVRQAFGKLGDTLFELADLAFANPQGLFAPVSVLNQVRRDLAAALELAVDERRTARTNAIAADLAAFRPATPVDDAAPRFILKTDRFAHLADFTEADFADAAEVIVDIGRETLETLQRELPLLRQRIGAEKLRLALPVVVRAAEEAMLAAKISWAKSEGHGGHWQAANLAGFFWIPKDQDGVDHTADWPLYCTNAAAAKFLLERTGCQRVAINPEVPREVIAALLPQLGGAAEIILYQDVPLAYSQSCFHANQRGGCVGKPACDFTQAETKSERGERLLVINDWCRSVFINQTPFCLAKQFADLRSLGARQFRIDFIWRPYAPAEAVALWRRLCQGQPPAIFTEGNYSRQMG